MKDYANRLGNIELVDDQEHAVVVASAWQDRPALLVFIRHFG